ncbi:trans-sulfuration enzyme family protein [Capillimicrobium parvum]|uniref:homocysteine desulfhydrase n=1 Tax=Capillimicrobium parvum TaxID=2884022 RepID=A0A9E7C0G4_9ACTN|nr:aminotransferase class I/II-fold pyridoxal phosphate-dependent enzyme [Capillimicrobium parvum]UGS36390.1 Cystathionine beta-lyase [Capillimicrobium parvum]
MSETPRERHVETSLLRPAAVDGAITPPIHPASTFAARDAAELRELATRPRERRFYTRYGNPTHEHAEAIVAELEGAGTARVFSSGMAAISTTVLALCAPGDHVVAQNVHYAGTLSLLQKLAPRMGIDVTFADQADTAALTGAIGARTALVVLETPSNPMLAITDLRAVSEAAHAAGARVLVDNTLASPINQRPLAFGADLVVHSATKYLGGHSDLTAGVVCGPPDELGEIWDLSLTLGGVLSAFDAWLLQRGLRTLAVRVARQNATAQALAELLEGHPAVRAVHYPGLRSHPQHALAAAQMDGFGGLLSFELGGGVAAASALAERLELFDLAPSLGGVHSLIVPPAAMLAGVLDEQALEAGGAAPGLLRIAVGLEHPDDLAADLRAALDAAAA